MFRDSALLFPWYKMVLGRYLGPSIDIGPSMTVKILKSNGEGVRRLTYRYLLSEELEITEQKNAWGAFDASVSIKCGPGATVEGFYKLGTVETPDYYMYEYDNIYGACPKSPPGELYPTPDAASDHYLNVPYVLP